VNAPPALATRSSSAVAPLSADEELGLAELLDLFTPMDLEELAPSPLRSLRSDGIRLRAWAQRWVRRATEWGAGPGGAWRAW
jgi:hypothetical protein